MDTMIKAALYYAKHYGWFVFPLVPGSKEPHARTRGHLDATTDEAQIKEWWSKWPESNVGLYCQKSGIIALDQDVKNDKDGYATLQKIKHDCSIPDHDTLINLTPSGGAHELYALDPEYMVDRETRLSQGQEPLGPGLDIRWTGYIVLPPSTLTERKGQVAGQYAWDAAHHPEELKPIPLPEPILDLLIEATTASIPIIKEPLNAGNRPGDLWAKDKTWADVLGPYDWTEVRTSPNGTTHWRRPDKDRGTSATTGHNGNNTFYVFSSNAPPFKAGQSYNKFSVFALLEHKGNFKLAASDLANQGFKADDEEDVEENTKKNPTTSEFIAALDMLGYSFRMNICNDMIEVNDNPMSDALRAKIRSEMRDIGYRQVNVMEDAWISHAYDNQFHPVRDFLDGLVWDQHDYIGELCEHFEDRRGYFGLFTYRWLIGAVARAYEKCQNRMLILDGKQGIGKSYFAQWLARPLGDELFIEGPIIPDEKDCLLRLITSWLWEVSELGSTTRRADREALKYFLSMRQVTVRKPYGHYDLVKPALANFIGTVNNEAGILNDPTGNRRFMAVHMVSIDWSYASTINPVNVWAQAKALYQAGETWTLKGPEGDMATNANEEYEISDPLEDLILKTYEITGDKKSFVPTLALIDDLRSFGWRLRSPRAEAMAIAAVLRQYEEAGVEAVRMRSGGSLLRGYLGISRKIT